MAGRIETYVHSDSTTQNKGGAMVRVTAQTDFAAKTPEFIGFAQKVARMSYAASMASEDVPMSWDVVDSHFDLEPEREALSKNLGERIEITNIEVLSL